MALNTFHPFTDMVAFIVGGVNTTTVELYSPNGKCSVQLANLPSSNIGVTYPIVGIVNQDIIACDDQTQIGFQKCWIYIISNNTWSPYATSNHVHKYPGAVYNEKLYSLDPVHPEVLDPATKIWSPWPTLPVDPKGGSCLVVWRDQVE